MYFLKRLLLAVPLLGVISLFAFGLLRLAPGGPFDRERAPASPEVEQTLRARYHLDEPLPWQYLRYLGLWWERGSDGRWERVPGGLIVADFGPSLKYRSHRVNDVIRQALPVSAGLGLLAFLLALGTGIPLGVYTAVRREAWRGQLGNTAALLVICIPALVLGPLLVLGFGLALRWFPVALWESPRHMVLPVVTLGLFFGGRVARLMREGLLDVLQSGFITAARARGLGTAALWGRHAFPLGVLPVVSYSGPLLADLLTGSFVVENLFQIPGVGVFLVNGTLNRDYPLVIGLVVIYSLLLLVLNLAADLLYTVLDPRVRYDHPARA